MASRLTAGTLRGVWAGVTMPWNDDYSFNAGIYVRDTEAMCRAGVHGIYTTGSTGEFYALSFAEFREMVDIQAEVCGSEGVPLQIGCCSDNTRATIQMVEYAAGKPEVGAAQVNIPYWMELSDRELLQFFKDLYSACPELPLIHYNIPRAKRFLGTDDYLRILEVAPALIGVKYTFAGSHFADLQDALLRTPQLSYFVSENLLVSGMMLGARGCCSSLIATDPAFMLKLYALATARQWDEAIEMQKTVHRFFAAVASWVEARGEGTIDPVFDKGLSVAAGCSAGPQRTRPPYIGWSDKTVAELREWLREKYPQFLHPSIKGT